MSEGRGRYSSNLTPAELEVLTLICEGLSNKEIALRRFVSPETVKQHVRHVQEKILVGRTWGSPTRVPLANAAYRLGLVPCPCPDCEARKAASHAVR